MGGKFMLTELLYEDSLTTSTQTMLRQLIYSRNIVPILAHIDRYPFLMKEKNLYSLLEMGCVAQMNLSSMSDFFKRKKLTKYLEKGYIGVIGSDIHNKTQTERITSGLSYINSEDLDYINEVSHGILKKVKRDSDNAGSVIVVD
jgi:protein-tyrosine phosphatase